METQISSSSFPEEALHHVLSFIDSRFDRSSASLVCKSWYDIERWCRRDIFIGNCYSVSPPILTRRFTDVRSITIKGKHMAADYDHVPDEWGAHALPWFAALTAVYPALEEIRMKRMVVTDEGLELIGRKLQNLRVLIFKKCQGFSTDGLATIAANCRKLRTLNLSDSEVEDLGGNWVSNFPEAYTALESLNVDILKSELPMSAMERLVSNCGNLKLLRLNRSFPLEKLMILLSKAPRLVDLGTGSFSLRTSTKQQQQRHLATAFAEYCCTNTGLKNLSGLWDADPSCLPAIYPLCSGLTSLDLRNSTQLRSPHLVQLLRHCPNLQTLSVLDYIEDRGLEEVATSCKKLLKLRVLFSDPYYAEPSINLTEQGLVSVVLGCPQLHHIMYFCNQMTNAALLTIANHNPNLTALWLCINEFLDHLTGQPLDDGYAAILERCENLRSLAIAGPVTDGLLEHIGTHGKRLEALWLIFAGQSDAGLQSILSGCNNLRKLWIRDSPFSGQVLLANSDRLQRMRFLWMFSCNVGYRSCKLLGEKHPRLNIEVVVTENKKPPPPPLHSTPGDCLLERLYVYRTVAGPRLDMPSFEWNINQESDETGHGLCGYLGID